LRDPCDYSIERNLLETKFIERWISSLVAQNVKLKFQSTCYFGNWLDGCVLEADEGTIEGAGQAVKDS
jgi:hypothetical protein